MRQGPWHLLEPGVQNEGLGLGTNGFGPCWRIHPRTQSKQFCQAGGDRKLTFGESVRTLDLNPRKLYAARVSDPLASHQQVPLQHSVNEIRKFHESPPRDLETRTRLSQGGVVAQMAER